MEKIKRFWQWVLFVFTHEGEIADEAVAEGICDYSGQGKERK